MYITLSAGEPVSVSVDSDDSTLGLSQLSPGSSYEVNVISILGLDESDPIKDFVMTREYCVTVFYHISAELSCC